MKVLITGGSGFLGRKLIEKINELAPTHEGPIEIKIIGRSEGNLVKTKELFPNIEIAVGDVTDKTLLRSVMLGMDFVFHAAALKHVVLAEQMPAEYIRVNVEGSRNLLELSCELKTPVVVGISTDKAATPSGVYSTTKYLMERMFHEAAARNPRTAYRLVRFGNIMYSTGSVLEKWKNKIQNNLPCTIYDPNSTRFYWTVDEAVMAVIQSLNNKDCNPTIPTMKSIRTIDLYNAMVMKYGSKDTPQPEIIGLQNGEVLHETLLESSEHNVLTIEEILKII